MSDSAVLHSYLRTVIVFILIYASVWTVATYSLDPTVPSDALEALNWANNHEFGSPKNPYFVGWIATLGLHLEPLISVSLYWYLSHFCGVGVGLMGIWLLSRRLFGDNEIAVLSLMCLNMSGIINFDIIPYNDNYLLVTLWPYMFLFFIKAVYDNSYHWISLAVVSGIAAMSKYSSCAFLPSMFVYTLIVPQARRAYRSPTIYLAILILGLIALPNVVWLWTHDFAAFNWVSSRLRPGINIDLFIVVLTVFYPIIIAAFMLKWSGVSWALPDTPEKRCILWLLMPPLVLILGYLFAHRGGRMTEWLEPFVIFCPAALFCFMSFKQAKNLKNHLRVYVALALVVVTVYSVVLVLDIGGAGTRNIEVIGMSAELNSLWREKYNQRLKYVGGGRFAHWLTFYAPDRPLISTPWSNERKPNIYNANITEAEIRESGVLFVSDPDSSLNDEDMDLELSMIPTATVLERQSFSYQNTSGKTVTVTLAFLPPQMFEKD